MKSMFLNRIEQYRIAMAGLVAVFALQIFIEIVPTIYLGYGIAAVALGIVMARLAARHFGHGHHHVGDSAIDVVPVAVLIFANIAHPAIDGFTAIETFRVGGVAAGSLFAGSVLLHEIVRQSFLSAALRAVHVSWKWVVGTALIGIAIGVGAAVIGADMLHQYETVADIATLFSYSFVIAEFYILGKSHASKKDGLLCMLGILIGISIVLITNTH